MKELLEGRGLGFALRPLLGAVALGLGIGTLVLDLFAWFQWGPRETNGLVWGAYVLCVAAAVLIFLAGITALAEIADVDARERSLARLDLAVLAAGVLATGASAALRSFELSQAGAGPAALMLNVFGLVAGVVGVVVGGSLYASREWEEIVEELPRERNPRRRAAGRA